MWAIKVYNTKTEEKGYLCGDVINSIVDIKHAWKLSSELAAADGANRYLKDNNDMFYRLERLK